MIALPAPLWALAIGASDCTINIDLFTSEPLARNALMRDLYEHYQEYDLPEGDSDREITDFINTNDIDFDWSIVELTEVTA
jgi:hypothetical protein